MLRRIQWKAYFQISLLACINCISSVLNNNVWGRTKSVKLNAFFLVSFIFFLSFADSVSAKVLLTAKVKYERETGWSQWVETEVTFMRGSELNEATSTFRYNSFKSYAVIFFFQDQVAIIEQTNFSICSSGTFAVSCLPSIGNFEGKDSQERKWKICTQEICF